MQKKSKFRQISKHKSDEVDKSLGACNYMYCARQLGYESCYVVSSSKYFNRVGIKRGTGMTEWRNRTEKRNGMGIKRGTEKRNGMGIKRGMGIKLTTILYKTRHSF